MNFISSSNGEKEWRCSAVALNGREFILLIDDGVLQWFSTGHNEPDSITENCISQRLDYSFRTLGHFMINSVDDMVLVKAALANHALLVKRGSGVLWEGDKLSSVEFFGRRVLAQYDCGKVEVIDGNTSTVSITSRIRNSCGNYQESYTLHRLSYQARRYF
jgi:hypothetical protein